MMFTRAQAAIGLVAAGLAASSLAAAELRLLSAWDDRYGPVKHMAQEFADAVRRGTNGAITIKRSGPEVVPLLQQLQPVSAGAFDLLFSHGGYHAGQTGIGVSMDAIAVDPAARRRAGVWELVDRHYQERFNLKLLALPTAGTTGYQLFMRKPLGDDDLKGLKIRAGNSFHNLVTSLGGAPVRLAPTDVYSALDKGVVDGASFAMLGALDFKWYEVAKHYVRPAFGTATHILLMNLAAWRKLSATEQALFLAEGATIEDRSVKLFDELIEAEVDELRKRGMQETRLKADAATVERLFREGVWINANSGPTAGDVTRLREAARKANLTD